MAVLGTLIKSCIKLFKSIEGTNNTPAKMQINELKSLLKKARHTDFGFKYNFNEILKRNSDDHLLHLFKENVPVFTYSQINKEWWSFARQGEENVCWPGKVKYFATSSGTSEASTKYIPLTQDMINAIQKTGVRQLFTLEHYDLPECFFETEVLMISGCTSLTDKGCYFEGDLSGIQALQLPFWFKGFYRPGKKIASIKDWSDKIDAIARNASKWDVGVIMGVPSWNQILLERIISFNRVKNIHEIWPNLKIFVHGGVALEPYMNGFNKLLGKPLIYMETYLASEGFLAYQSQPSNKTLSLVLDNGVFFEFIAFTEENFTEDGDLKPDSIILSIDQTLPDTEYAILISTCSGAWRYLIGDVIKFTGDKQNEIIITGRTKHFLSLIGEHLSVDNMNEAIRQVSDELKIDIREFTVTGVPYQSLFAHQWYIGTDDTTSAQIIKDKLDRKLKELNKDYKTKRNISLKEIYVDVIPSYYFYKWLKMQNKEGGQNKFPRVLKEDKLKAWQDFIVSEHALRQNQEVKIQ
ncbi:MAG: GH3 auxin-responsive promoter family protein [Bacteroidetes bacterium]|nr:GH3 auxin-responsive promoter family protein [Bacteroidota bacterium]HET6245300.1 GH3 auxin-responsive promoter family protein [Bacteroidia bacterium]